MNHRIKNTADNLKTTLTSVSVLYQKAMKSVSDNNQTTLYEDIKNDFMTECLMIAAHIRTEVKIYG